MRNDSPPEILHELESFRQMGSVLLIAAHPDDENTELLTYLARGRDYRTAYLSLTRGDGGQNLLGPDIGEKLGVARTQELLAARKLDGAQQFFSRAVDFGFSKSYIETFNVWDKQEVLSDVVRIIRRFRPDVVITRFSPSPGGTHGHHTASAVLAMEAFKLSGNAKAFPEQRLQPWQPKRIFWNVSTFQADKIGNTKVLKIEAGGKDSVTGESFAEIAQESRAMHKTQGFDQYRIPGIKGGSRLESFQLLDGEPATKDILDGVDTSWNRVPGGAEIGKSVDQIISQFKPDDVAASVPALLDLRLKLKSLSSDDPVIKEKKQQLDLILQACLSLKTETTITRSSVVPGEPMTFHHTALVGSNIPVTWIGVQYPRTKTEIGKNILLKAHDKSSWDSVETLPANTPLTQPYWLQSDGTPGMVHVNEPDLIGTAENAPSFPIEDIFEVEGQKLVVSNEPVEITANSAGKEIRHRLDVIPPVTLRFVSEVALFAPGGSREIEVAITSSRANSAGVLRLVAPTDWKIKPPEQPFDLANVGQHTKLKFMVTAPEHSATTKLTANAEINGAHYSTQRDEITYPHIPPELLQAQAKLKLVSLDLATRGHTVGYLPGAGDSLVENLEQMGYKTKILDAAILTPDELHGLDAVVVGVRAFNVRKTLATEMPVLLEYVKDGGTVLVQYNRSDGLKTDTIAPYDIHLSRDRITDETAQVTFLAPQNAVLNTPNKITSADFDGWVQERGLYLPDKWDDRFTAIVAFNDPGEKQLNGSLLVAPYGKGYFIYTGLAFFRQLPAGVPGAYRLLANLLSIGK